MSPDNRPSPDWDELGQWLQKTHERSTNRHAYPPHVKSLLARDEQGMPEGSSVAAVVRSLLDAAVDDLTSAFDLAGTLGRLHPAGIPTLIRSSIELSCLGMWVLTDQGKPGRQERALRVAHDSLFNGKKYFSHLAANSRVPADVRHDATGMTGEFQRNIDGLLSNAAFLVTSRGVV